VRPHQEALLRLCAVPGMGIMAAQQIVAEIGSGAKAFPTPAQLSSGAGVCPGQPESAGTNRNRDYAKATLLAQLPGPMRASRGQNEE
jgi:transposase